MRKIIILILGLIALWGVVSPSYAWSQAPDLAIRAQLSHDGRVDITQEIDYQSSSQLDWQILTDFHSLRVQADESWLDERYYQMERQADGYRLTSDVTASLWRLSYQTETTLIRGSDQDRLYLKLFDEPGFEVGRATIVFKVPDTLKSEGLYGNLYGIQGVTQPTSTLTSPNELTYQFDSIGTRAIVTINANWPKEILRLSFWREIKLLWRSLELIPWLILGLALPLAALFILWRLTQRVKEGESVQIQLTSKLPSPLSPLLVGVLVKKKIYPEVIVALLIDLCRRGYLVIVKKGGEYFLAQRRELDRGLIAWEKDLISEIFPELNEKISREQMLNLNKKLYSPIIRRAFGQIYQVVTDAGIFAENPHWTRVKYKLLALGFYFVAAIGLIWVALTGAASLLLIPLAGTMLISYLLIRLTPRLVRYTHKGLEVRREWLGFAAFLSEKEPLPAIAARDKTFEYLLPYAVALNCPKEWAKRFDAGSSAIITPDWFIGFGMSSSSTTRFVEELVAFAASVSRLITSLRGPTVN